MTSWRMLTLMMAKCTIRLGRPDWSDDGKISFTMWSKSKRWLGAQAPKDILDDVTKYKDTTMVMLKKTTS